jgi:hypothetical protein
MNFCVKAYLAMPYRGPLGDMATAEDIHDNIETAREIGFAIQSHFQKHLELYIPHLDAELQSIESRDENGCIVGSPQILANCCAKVSECDIIIHCGEVSAGMQMEIDHAKTVGIDVVEFPLAYTDKDFELIMEGIFRVWRRKQ